MDILLFVPWNWWTGTGISVCWISLGCDVLQRACLSLQNPHQSGRWGPAEREKERGTGKLHRPTGTPFFPQFKVCLSHWPSLSCPGTDWETLGPRAGVVISHDWPDVNRDNSEPSLLLTITMLSYEKWSLVAKARSSELYQFDWIIFSKMWKGVKNSSLCNSLSNIRFTAMSLHWKSQGSICHKLGLNKAISLYVYSNMSP